MPAIIVVAKLNTTATANWLPSPGQRKATELQNHPFLALFLLPGRYSSLGDSWDYFNSGKIFVVSPDKPEGLYQGLYCALSPTEPTEERSLSLQGSPLAANKTFYVHTLPALVLNKTTAAASPPSLGQLDDASFETLCNSVLHDVREVRRRMKDIGKRSSGGSELVEADWDSWSVKTGWDKKLRPRRQECIYDFLPNPFAFDMSQKPSILRELRLMRQLERDYAHKGVSITLPWVTELRQHASTDGFDPGIPPFACATVFDYEEMPEIDCHLRPLVETLFATKIPYDGEPQPEDDAGDPIVRWGDPSPDFDLAPEEFFPFPNPPSIFATIAFDPVGTFIDRETAIYRALQSLNPDPSSVTPPYTAPAFFIEHEALRTRAYPDLPAVENMRHALRETAHCLGYTFNERALERALDTLRTPLIYPDAAPFFKAVGDEHFVLAFPIPETLFSTMPSFPSCVRWLPASAGEHNLYSPNLVPLSTLFEHAQLLLPGITASQIVVASSSIYRTVEPANSLGYQTAHIIRPSSMCSWPRVELTGSTYVASDLVSMCLDLGSLKGFRREYNMNRAFWPPYRIQQLWQCHDELGSGGFGTVYSAFNLFTNEEVAIKVDMPDEELNLPCALPYEKKIYGVLKDLPGIPYIRWYGEEGGATVMVMDKLGPTLDHLRRFCRGRFSMKTICMLALQMISRIELIHSRGIIVRDIKPENFAMGLGDYRSVLHLFDFGISKLYVDPTSGRHMPFRDGRGDVGTPRYVSYNAQFGRELGRRDDIEALGTVLLLFWHGRLPWQGIYAPDEQAKKRRMGEMKAGESMRELLARSPSELRVLVEHARSLDFEDRPDYDMVRHVFLECLRREGWENDGKFDWVDGCLLEKGTLIPEEYVWDEEVANDTWKEVMVNS